MSNVSADNDLATCPCCNADLAIEESVTRTYSCKDGDAGDSVQALGHYKDGIFESDAFNGFGEGRYDLLEDSDKCSQCEQQL